MGIKLIKDNKTGEALLIAVPDDQDMKDFNEVLEFVRKNERIKMAFHLAGVASDISKDGPILPIRARAFFDASDLLRGWRDVIK